MQKYVMKICVCRKTLEICWITLNASDKVQLIYGKFWSQFFQSFMEMQRNFVALFLNSCKIMYCQKKMLELLLSQIFFSRNWKPFFFLFNLVRTEAARKSIDYVNRNFRKRPQIYRWLYIHQLCKKMSECSKQCAAILLFCKFDSDNVQTLTL